MRRRQTTGLLRMVWTAVFCLPSSFFSSTCFLLLTDAFRCMTQLIFIPEPILNRVSSFIENVALPNSLKFIIWKQMQPSLVFSSKLTYSRSQISIILRWIEWWLLIDIVLSAWVMRLKVIHLSRVLMTVFNFRLFSTACPVLILNLS
jgi:hypothetical protein